MSSNIQSLDSIAPMEDSSKSGGSTDPVQNEFDEGKKHLENNEYGQAAVCLHNALVGYEEKKDDNGIANASNQLGRLCLARKDFDNALPHFHKAFSICDASNDRMSIIAILHKVVEVYVGLEDFNSAIENCLELLDHYQDNRDPQGSVDLLEKMASIYVQADQNSKAADAYRTIASIHKNFQHESIAKKYLNKAAELES